MTAGGSGTAPLRALLPAVGGRPLAELPRGLYAYVMAASRRQQVPLVLLTLAIFPLTLAPIDLQRRLIDDAIGGRNPRLLLILAGLYLAAVLLQAGLKLVRNIYQERVAQGITRRLRRRIIEDGDGLADGTAQSILVAEAEKLGGFVGEAVAFPLLQAGIVVSVAGYMLAVDPAVAIVALGLFVPSIVAVALMQPRLDRLAGRKTEATRELGDAALDDDRSEAAETRLDRLVETIYGLRIRFAVVKFALKSFNNLLGHLGPLSILAIGGWLVLEGSTTVGTIVAFASGYQRMTDPARDLLNFYRRLSLMRVQYRMVREAAEGL